LALSLNQQTSASSTATATSASKAFASSVTANDFLVMALATSVAVTSLAVSGGCSGTWTQAGTTATNTAQAEIYYCSSASGGTTTISLSWTTAARYTMGIYDSTSYTATGLTCNTGTGTGTAYAVTSTAFSGSPLLIATYGTSARPASGATITAGASFALNPATARLYGYTEYSTSGVTTPTTFPMAASGSLTWAGVGCGFPAQTAWSATASPTLALSPTVHQVSGGVGGSSTMTLAPSTNSAVQNGVSGILSLVPTLAIQAALSAAESATSSLGSTLNQGLDGVTNSVSALLAANLAGALQAAASSSMALVASVGQGMGGVSNSVSMELSPVLASIVAYAEALSASISLSSGVGQDFGGVAQSVSTTLSPSLTAVAAFFADISASISLIPAIGQGLAGLTNSVSLIMSPNLSSLAAFAEMLSATISIVPSLNQDLAGLTNTLFVALSPSFGEGIAGIIQSGTTVLTPSLSSVAAFLETLSQSVSLTPAVSQGIAGLANSVSTVLAPTLSAMAAFTNALSASISLSPIIDQSLAGVGNAVSTSLSSSLSQDLAAMSNSVSVALTPSVSAIAAAVYSFSAALSLAPSIGQGLADVRQSVPSVLTATVNEGLGGIVEAVNTSVSSVLEGIIAFFESVLGLTSLAPSLTVAASLLQAASIGLSPSLTSSVLTLPPTTTSVSCSGAVIAEGTTSHCTATVTGASPGGAVSFSSPKGTFTPSSSCTLAGGSCEVGFVAPSSTGVITIAASYSGDANNAPSSQTFDVTVPVFGISPVAGAAGAPTTLSGSGFAPSTVYNYCFESGIGVISNAVPCSAARQFMASSSGSVPASASLSPTGQTGLVVVSDAGGDFAAFQTFTVVPSTTRASITLTPTSGVTGTPVTVTGSGFTPGATITLVYSNGTLTTSPSTVTVSSGGAFTARFDLPSSTVGSNVVAAIASDPGDSSSASFTVTNVRDYQSTSVTANSGGTISLDESGTTGVGVTISTTPGASGTVVVTRLTDQPSFGVASTGLTNVRFYDVFVSSGISGSSPVEACFTDLSVTAASVLEYWDGGSWAVLTSVVAGTTICNSGTGEGAMTASQLRGTNFAIGTSPSGGGGGAAYVSESVKLTQGTEGAPVSFSLSGCGVIPSLIQGDGQPHNIAAYPGCTVSVVSAAPKSDSFRYVFAGGNQTVEVTTCSGLSCSSSFNATYFEQVIQSLSYSVVGASKGFSAPTVTALQFGSRFTATLTTVQTGYWTDASGSITAPSLLAGSGSTERWSLQPSSLGMISAETPNSLVLVYALQYSIAFAVSPQSAGTTNPTGSNWLNADSGFTVSANASVGFSFSVWVSSSGNATFVDQKSSTTVATVFGPDTLTAKFAPSTSTSTSSTSTSTNSTSTTSGMVSTPNSSVVSSVSATSTTASSSVSGVTSTTGSSPQGGAFSQTTVLALAIAAAAIATSLFLVVRRTRKRRKN